MLPMKRLKLFQALLRCGHIFGQEVVSRYNLKCGIGSEIVGRSINRQPLIVRSMIYRHAILFKVGISFGWFLTRQATVGGGYGVEQQPQVMVEALHHVI